MCGLVFIPSLSCTGCHGFHRIFHLYSKLVPRNYADSLHELDQISPLHGLIRLSVMLFITRVVH